MNKKFKNKLVVSVRSELYGNENYIEKECNSNIALREDVAKGLSKPNASTGTPIDALNGAAVITARISNVGGGSKETGGGGMLEGIKKLMKLAESDGKLNTQRNTLDNNNVNKNALLMHNKEE